MKRPCRSAILGLALILVCCGCSSLQNYTLRSAPARASAASGDYQTALSVFPDSDARGANEILIRLERAMILQDMGRFEESSREFEMASDRITEHEEKAVISASQTFAQAGTLLINEQVMTYEGEDFETIMLHTLNILNYLMLGDLEGARVEVRRAYSRQKALREKHEKELAQASQQSDSAGWEQSLESGDSQGYARLKERAATVRSVYQNAFASYLSALVYELHGELDEAYIDVKDAHRANPEALGIRADLVRLSRVLGYRDDAQRWEGMFGRQALPPRDAVDVFVVFSHGQAPVREPVTLPIPIRGGMVFASLPVYRFIPSGVSGAVVSAGDERMETSTVCDVDAMAARNLLDRFPLLFAKQVARSYLKARSVSAMERHHGAAGALLGVLFSAVTEQADLRTWSMLPKQVQTARLFVPPHTPAVTLHAAPGGPQATVPIPAGARHLLVYCRSTDAGLSIRTKWY